MVLTRSHLTFSVSLCHAQILPDLDDLLLIHLPENKQVSAPHPHHRECQRSSLAEMRREPLPGPTLTHTQ